MAADPRAVVGAAADQAGSRKLSLGNVKSASPQGTHVFRGGIDRAAAGALQAVQHRVDKRRAGIADQLNLDFVECRQLAVLVARGNAVVNAR